MGDRAVVPVGTAAPATDGDEVHEAVPGALHAAEPAHAQATRGGHPNILAQTKSFLAWCVERNWLRANPCAEIKGIGKRRPRGKSLGKDGATLRVKEARAWYSKAVELAARGDRGATAALTAMLLGLRASEIVSRRVSDLDEDEAPGDLLWIPCAKTPAGRRTLEVPGVLRPLLVACVDGKAPAAYLFEAEDGKAHWRDWIIHDVRRICDLAKVPRVTAMRCVACSRP